jgi:hypothetical protein
MAWSRVSNAATLLSSSAAAAGAGAAAALADFAKLNVATDPTAAMANTATRRRLVVADLKRVFQLSIHIFIFLSPCATKYVVAKLQKIFGYR